MNTILITGTSRGIGRALKEAFEARGDCVVGYQRDSDGGDITALKTIVKLKQLACERRVNVLVNNAGVYSPNGICIMTSSEAKRIVETNLIAPMVLTCALWRLLIEESGTVVFINSTAGRNHAGGEVAYRATKFGLTGFSGALFYEGKRDGVRVIDVPLGGVNTDMLKHRPGMDKNPQQQPVAAAELILQILDSHNSTAIRHFLLQDRIIDNRCQKEI